MFAHSKIKKPAQPAKSKMANYNPQQTRQPNHLSHSPQLLPRHVGNSALLQKKCACKEDSSKLQQQTVGDLGGFEALPLVHKVLRSPGQPLDESTQAFMESRLGHYFDQVRIHQEKVQNLLRTPVIQPKLKIGAPNDKYEREADLVANEVMWMPNKVTNQRISSEEEDETQIRRMGSVENAMDFSQVRIHTDADAARSASMINAHAYTIGRDIIFGRGKYTPETQSGKRLLAHELAHTIQQGASSRMVQADFAVAPTTPNRTVPTLSATDMQNAIAFNQAKHTDATEIALIRDILGISSTPAVINADFVNAVVRYQAQFGLSRDGKLGHNTADRLAKEIIAEGNFLGANNLGSLAPAFSLKTSIRTLISANNRTYATYKTTIKAATMLQQHVALRDQQLLKDLKGKLSWNNWARCIELLGRRAPSGNRMRRNTAVRAALNAAWTASNPAITKWPTFDLAVPATNPCQPPPPPPPFPTHEEGGFIYMNLITGRLTTRSVSAGGQAGLVLNAPQVVTDSIVVGGFHTHPNVGACWGTPAFSGADNTWTATNGVPLLMIGAFPAVANTSTHATGSTRKHLAGNRGLPGAAGGLAPQATRFGDFDEV